MVGPSDTMSTHHKSNIGSASFMCYCRLAFVLDQDTSSIRSVIGTTTVCLMLGHRLRLWIININTALGHRQHDTLTQYWFNVDPLFATTGPALGKHWANVGLSCLRCGQWSIDV